MGQTALCDSEFLGVGGDELDGLVSLFYLGLGFGREAWGWPAMLSIEGITMKCQYILCN